MERHGHGGSPPPLYVEELEIASFRLNSTFHALLLSFLI
jgi:hypothetical protein